MRDLSLLKDLVVIFASAVVVVLLVARLRLPSIAGMILAGALIGPHALGWIGERERVEALAEVGVVLLLFGIGLEMPFERLRQLWKPTLVGGGLQLVMTGLAAFALARLWGQPTLAALVTSFVVVPSSTAIVLRALDSRGEVDAPQGKLMLGVLLFQDLCVVPMMLVLSALTSETHAPSPLASLLRAVGVLALVALGARLLVPKVLHLVATSRQRDVFVMTVFVVSIGTAWAVSLAGVSLALGAFLSGVVVAGSEYRHQVAGELNPFREVFASLFFVSAGMLLDLGQVVETPALVSSVFLLLVVGKCLVVMLVALLLRQSLRVALIAGLGLAQIGEFALVMLRTSHGNRALHADLADSLLTAAILSMLVTPLLLALGYQLAARAERVPLLLRLFHSPDLESDRARRSPHSGHVVLAGYGVAGRALAQRLAAEHVDLVVVDLNTVLVRAAARDGFPAYFGDVASPEVLERVGVRAAREVVLLINDPNALERAVVAIRGAAAEATIVVRTRYQGEVARLTALGADSVIAAEVEAGRAVIDEMITRRSTAPPPRP